MARDATHDRVEHRTDARSGLYSAEHGLAWVMALAALVMVAIGLLVGFGVIGGSTDIAGTTVDEVTDTQGAGSNLLNWQEGVLWLLPAVSIAFLARTLHNSDHHKTSATRRDVDSSTNGMFAAEHGLAYLMALATLVGATLGLLVGFDVFDNANTFEDGMLWSLSSIIPAVLAATLHSVRHHQTVTDEDVIVRIIEERSMGPTTATPRTERVVDRPEARPL